MFKLKRQLAICCTLVAVLCLLTACQPELATLSATSSKQLSDYPVVAGKLTQDGGHTFLLLANNHVQLWENDNQEKVREWQQLDGESLHLAISKDGETFVTANQSTLSLWQSDKELPIGSLDFSQHLQDANITAIAFWRAPNVLLVGTSAGTVIVADIYNQTYRAMQQHTGEVTKFAHLNDTQYLLSGGNDGMVLLWDMQTYEMHRRYETPFRITSLAVSERSSTTFISDALEQQVIWHPIQDRVLIELKYWQQYQWFRLAKFIEDDKYLVTSSPKTEMTLWDISQNKAVAMWAGKAQSMGSTILDMKYLPGNQLMTLTSDAVLENWDVSTLIQ